MRISDPGEEGQLLVRYDIVSDGGTKIRLKLSTYVEPVTVGEEILYTWDGSQMLLFSLQNAVPYTVYEAPSEHPDEFQMVTHWRENMWSATKGARCTELKATTKIIGRIAVGYRCVTATPHPGEPAAGDLWLDQATGILLKNEVMVAEKLVLNPKVDATTFSTRPPAGAKVTVIAAKNASPGQTKKAPDFTLDLVKGGRIGLKDLVGKPFVLAFFMSDLSFDEKGEVCPGCRDALLTLQTLTGNGAEPRVLGVQVGDLGKPGYPLVVPGVTLTLAHEQTPVVQNSFGLTEMLGFVFVRSDGTVASTYDRAPTKQQITQSLAALH
jgi:AhpC/TSA family